MVAYGFKKSTKTREMLSSLCHKKQQQQSENRQVYDSNPYIVCIFVFTALNHCTLCRDCTHIFVSFQTVFCDRVELNISLLCSIFFSHKQPYIFSFFHVYIVRLSFCPLTFSMGVLSDCLMRKESGA